MNLLYIDLFCGAGGTSTGVESARVDGKKCAKVIACVNHDKNAIASHAANHPDALHFTEDIRTLQLSPLVDHTDRMRRQYPGARLVLWASLECTNFSKAKGGQPRDADSRTLAEHLFRYIEALDPDYIQIENVEEFMSWGDMDENGKPISRDKGKSYVRWCNRVRRYGYDFEHRILNSADYGAYTSRKRFFGIFAKHGLPIAWPEPTHSKNGIENGLFGSLPKWKPVKEVLDFEEEGESIFCRKKPLADKTLERIYAGLIKFVAGGKDAFMVKWNSMSQRGKYVPPSVDAPCPTVATQQRLGVAKVSFLSKQFSGAPDGKNQSIEKPAGSITTKDHHAFVTAYYGNGHNHSVEAPAPVLTCKDRLAVVNSKFLCSYNFKDSGKDISQPCPTLLTKDRLSLITPRFLDMQYGNGTPVNIEDSAPTVTTNPKHQLVTCKSAYLMNPQYSNAGGSVDKPCFTLIARMDKMPPYLVQTETGEVAIVIEPTDSDIMRKIKEFMSLYGIVDIKMRMLLIPELMRIMGFPEDYVLVGTQAEQKKYIGNAVEVGMARALCKTTSYRLLEYDKAA